MNRTTVGVLLLVVLLAGGIVSAAGLDRQSEALASQLDAAARLAMAGDLLGAIQTAEEAWSVWEKGRKISAAFTDHNPLDQIDTGFARLQLYGEAGDPVAYASVCVELAKQVKAISDAHGAQWWNIL